MHYAEKKKVKLTTNTAREFAYYMASIIDMPRLHDDHLENELLCYHALTIRDKVLLCTYRVTVARKKNASVQLTKGEVYALAKIFRLGKISPLMHSIKYQITNGI
jgi:hypothetical protein